ncbi:MAG TPA: DUF2062 domain-containing protein [Bryobacteraceae bacterium]|nr:DUF2062 domain-containing protein [Bryobacteraceae bacterium]
MTAPLRRLAATLWHEGLTPGRAAAAVFVGIFIGNVPIYGFQTLAAIGLAVLFGLNKPLTLAATFINNPLFQPFLVAGSVAIGHFLLTGKWHVFAWPDLSARGLKEGLSDWVAGSVPLGAVLGGIGALVAFLVVRPGQGESIRFVNQLFAACPRSDRGFVRWKLRLDRIFEMLAAEDLGSGAAVDLGCGYGIALGLAAFAGRDRPLMGCDLNPRRIAAARQALPGLHADVRVADVRSFEIPRAGLILILDVLQYLSAEDQSMLLARCCAALEPGGKFIFRVHDRQRAILEKITLGFDRLIFLFGRAGRSPATLAVENYRSVLEEAGMRVVERRFVNRLPLAHVLFVAEKPAPEAKL